MSTSDLFLSSNFSAISSGGLFEPKSMEDAFQELALTQPKYHDYEYPKVTVVIPTLNCAQALETTLDSVIHQIYPDFEVIIVDAGSTDHTLETVRAARSSKVRLLTTSTYQPYEMLNKGITQATGKYINFLFPGDFYIYSETLKEVMNLAIEHNEPELVFCGTLLRDGRSEVKLMYRHLTMKLLKRGQQPTSLQSIWFKAELFRELGKFNTSYQLRGGYEFLCRFALHKNLGAASTNRILTDYDLRVFNKEKVLLHFWETIRTIWRFFGLAPTMRWLFFYQRDVRRLLTLWGRSLRMAFTGK